MSRRSSFTRAACALFRARRNPGIAIAASRQMMPTTIMISTRVKPAGLVDFKCVLLAMPVYREVLLFGTYRKSRFDAEKRKSRSGGHEVIILICNDLRVRSK